MSDSNFKIKTPLGRKYLISLTLSTIILTVCICTVVTMIFRAKVLEHYDRLGFSISDHVASMFEGNTVDLVLTNGIEDSSMAQLYDSYNDFLQATKERFGLLYLYVAVPGDDTIVYLWDADEGVDAFMDEEQFSPGGAEWSKKVMNNQGERHLHTFNDPQYGSVATAATPIYDNEGKPVALAYCDFSLRTLVEGIITVNVITVILILLLMTIYTVVFYFIAKKSIVDPIVDLTVAAGEMTDNLDKEDASFVSTVNTGDEIEALSHAFENMDKELRRYIVENTRIVEEKMKLGTELNLARDIQASALPNDFPPFPDRNEFEIYATMDPAKEVGGDFYDFFMVDDDHLAMVVADVSDKGIPASLFMMESMILINSNSMLGGHTNEVLMRVNEKLCKNNPDSMFVTVWLGILELSTGMLRATSAGHEYPCIKAPGGKFELFKDEHGFVLGAMEGTPEKEYELKLEHGSTLYVYSDGVPDACNTDGVQFKEDRMIDALNIDPEADMCTLLHNVKISIDEFVGEADQFDDITMLGIRYN